MLVRDGVGSHEGHGGCISIFLGAFDVPSSHLFMFTSVLLSMLSLTVSIPIFLLVRPDFLTRVDSQLYHVRTVTAESREVRRSRLML